MPEEVDQALRRVFAQERLEKLFRLRGNGRTPGKEILPIGSERGLDITWMSDESFAPSPDGNVRCAASPRKG